MHDIGGKGSISHFVFARVMKVICMRRLQLKNQPWDFKPFPTNPTGYRHITPLFKLTKSRMCILIHLYIWVENIASYLERTFVIGSTNINWNQCMLFLRTVRCYIEQGCSLLKRTLSTIMLHNGYAIERQNTHKKLCIYTLKHHFTAVDELDATPLVKLLTLEILFSVYQMPNKK